MKHLGKLLAVLFAVGLVTFGCKPESTVAPKGEKSPEFGLAGDAHNRPDTTCMASVFAPLVDAQGNTQGGDPFDAGVGAYGTEEIVNSSTDLYVLITMGYYWLCSEGKLWVGQCGNVPLNTDGTVNYESFQWGSTVPLNQTWQWNMPYNSLMLDPNGCVCVVTVLEGVQSDFFGNAFNNTILWAKGTQSVGTNGFAVNACPVQCPFLEKGECYDINRSAGRHCTTLEVTCSTAGEPGTAPYTFTWKNATGAVVFTDVNNVGTSSYNACPVGTTGVYEYTVTVSDSRSVYADKIVVPVNLTPTCSAPCAVPVVTPGAPLGTYICGNTNNGPHKVNVCHLPPGNPQNRQTICIDQSALPSHIIDFKPADNRCMGHSPGCHVGPCDPCGPGTTDDAVARAAAYRQQYGCRGN
jgi:hypothetical protein